HLEVTPDARQHLDSCLLCEECSHVCPSGVEMERLGVAFRDEFKIQNSKFKIQWTLVERFAYGWLFGDLGHFRTAARALRWYQRSGSQWLARKLGIVRLLGLAEAERLLPEIPPRFVVPEDAAATGQCSVFAGCIMSTAFAPTTEHTAELLGVFGCKASFPAGQVCCGALQLHAGEAERARELARANLDAFAGDAPIVVNAAGCGAMLKHYEQLLPEDPRAQAFTARVKDVSEFLAERQPSKAPREVRRTVALQDACHLLHAQHIDRAPRKLLRAIPGLELREMAEPGLCCGSAGIYNVTHRQASAELQRRKCANIEKTGAELVVTGNPGCLLQIRAGLPESVEVEHIVDVLWEAFCHPEQSEGPSSSEPERSFVAVAPQDDMPG
ncbi:MAG TPA: (Fe-S)-binding protein, partial [Chloroflexota bacterium]|nr:(Fe-S)-binding protein [Chloroflexota bacterium]